MTRDAAGCRLPGVVATPERPVPSDADTTATRLAAILRDGFPSGYCIACLAARLDRRVPEVRDAAQILVMRPGFRVTERTCHTCGRIKDDVVVLDRAAQARRADN